jgi:HAD superfamily hydrolase (TIGR01549 family)
LTLDELGRALRQLERAVDRAGTRSPVNLDALWLRALLVVSEANGRAEGRSSLDLFERFMNVRYAGQRLSVSFDPEKVAEELGRSLPELHAATACLSLLDPLQPEQLRPVLLTSGGVPQPLAEELCVWLWQEQPKRNLWRRPIPGMIELVSELKRAGTPIAVISNSEGHLAELVDELGWTRYFDVVVDSGRLGIAKPDARIFAHACAALGVTNQQLLHVGDAWEADVKGALGASASAVWFDGEHRARELPEHVYGAGNALELREVLARLGFLS